MSGVKRYESIEPHLDLIKASLIAFRHDLHRHPELGYQEYRTAGKVLDVLATIPDIEIESGIAETGIVATFGAELNGPCVALRADMDALPVVEQSGVSYASEHPGLMHACGHDGHTAMLVGCAQVLDRIRHELEGPVKLIFQPAEEGGAGGKRMREAGVLESPKVDAVFGLHNMPDRQTHAGQFCLCPGAAMAGTGTFTITVWGKGGHAAMPHVCIDPVMIGASIVSALQRIVSRNTDPVQSAVVSVTQFHGGQAFNVIPDHVTLKGTFRALDPSILRETLTSIERIATGIASTYGGLAEVDGSINYPVLINADKTNRIFRQVIEEMGRSADYVEVPPIMGGEDFAFFAEAVPGTYWFLASRPKEVADVPFCHHPEFDFNDAVLLDGVRGHVEIARRFARLWTDAKAGAGVSG